MNRLNENAHGLGVVFGLVGTGSLVTAYVVSVKERAGKEIQRVEKNAALEIQRVEKNAALEIQRVGKNAALEIQRVGKNAALEIEGAKKEIERAKKEIERAKKETMENFLKFGYAEEFNRYQQMTGVKKGDDADE